MTAWRSVQVLAAACCAAVGAAQAQAQPFPGPAPVPEAVPIAVAPPYSAPPSGAPMGYPAPSPAPSFSEGLHNAAPCDCGWRATGDDCDGWYLYTGAMGMQRHALPSAPIAIQDPGVQTLVTQTVTVPVTFQTLPGTGPIQTLQLPVTVSSLVTTYPKTGAEPPAGSPTIGDYHDIGTGMDWGFRMTLGCRMDDFAFEFGGFMLFTHGSSELVSSRALAAETPLPVVQNQGPIFVPGAPLASILLVGSIADAVQQANPPQLNGRLDLPFFNAPPGFGVNGSLWRQADQVIVGFESSLGDFEFNTRYWAVDNDILQFQVLCGFRYLELQEKLNVLTQRNILTFGTDPTDEATYQVTTDNHMVMGQLGCDWEAHLGKLLSLDLTAKGAWGVNFANNGGLLVRGDGLLGFEDTRHNTGFTQMYELGVFGQVCVTPNIRFKAGYEMMWLLDVATALDQVDYDLSQHTGRNNDTGSVFFQGPVIEMQVHF